MGDSVGQVSLDLLLNSKEFEDKLNNAVSKATNNINGKMNKSLSKTGNLIGKIGKIAAGAFAVTKLVQFGKECVELGSNLAEVQNVVDSTFGSMSSKIDEWASHSIENMGMSEASAKKYAGTFGAMAKSFGFTGDAMVDMSEKITQLTSDTASFYNLSYDEAYTKMKSIFTGETESLKDLGVVMTQTALDQYALNNGFGKTTKNMTEQEKVALRYKFVMDKLSTASGDFQRTSGGWANQTRMLAENFNKLKASIGQGLINVLLPVIRVINSLMAKLQVLGEMFSNFTAKIFGKAETSASTISSSISNSLGGIEDTASGTSDAIGNVADSTTDAAKKISKTTFGFDELNTLQAPDDSSGGGSGAGDVGGGLGDTLTTTTSQQEALNDQTSVYETILDKIIKKAKELKDLFLNGFKFGLDTTNFNTSLDKIKTSLKSIKDSFLYIFSDGQVLGAFNNLINSFVYSLGVIVGDIVGVGASIVAGLTESIAKYLDSNKDFIKNKLINIFNVRAEIYTKFADIFNMLSEIISNFFLSDTFSSLGSNIIGIIVNPFLIVEELILNIFNDLLGAVAGIIRDNKDKIQTVLEGLLTFLNTLAQNIKDLIDFIGDKISSVYNEYIKPAISNIGEGLSNLVGTILDLWNSYVQPVLDRWGEKITDLFNSHIKPFVDSFITGIGKIINILSIVWKEALEPLISWILSIITPILMPLIEGLGNFIIDVVGGIFDILKWLMDKLVWIIEFVGNFIIAIKNGVQGLSNFISSLISNLGEFLSNITENIRSSVSDKVESLKSACINKFNSLKENISSTFNNLKNGLISAAENIRSSVSDKVESLKSACVNKFNSLKENASNSFNNLKDNCINAAKNLGSNVLSKFEELKNSGASKLNTFKDKAISAFENIKNGASSIFNGLKDVISNIFGSLVNIIKTPINSIIGIINSAINSINGLSIDIPEWVPGVGGSTFGFSLPNIPALANGGYITTPTLAMVGEGRENEIVAPESKLREIRDEGNNQTNLLLEEIVEQNKQLINIMTMLLNKNTDLNIDGYQLATVLNNINASETRRRG